MHVMEYIFFGINFSGCPSVLYSQYDQYQIISLSRKCVSL